MMHREKFELPHESQSQLPRQTISEKIASFSGSLRGLLLGSNLTGRRTQCPENLFAEDAQLTGFKKEKEEGLLKPKIVDLKKQHNRCSHHTSEYELPNLILRRGQPFDFSVTFDRAFQPESDAILLKFVTGSHPMQSKGTVIPIICTTASGSKEQGQWIYQMDSHSDHTVQFQVHTSSDAIVGRYHLFIETIHKNEDGDPDVYRHKQQDDVYILFNPWCEDDPVFMSDERQRDEYVLNETGRIWIGTISKFCVRPWNFAQFDDVCLMAALSLMERSELTDTVRGNPIAVVRALGRMINNNERDGGVLFGNWSGKYDEGVAPYAWNGSSAILEEFLKRRKGVKYGQCWTFAAVATTLFRALGIPTRCVTNFKSAHDSDYSGTADIHWHEHGKPHKHMDDHVWDFHVWNESWFARADLPDGYGGWQAFDATPKDVSEGVYTCGPAPVKAIRDGHLFIPYESKYIFAEVYGDRVHWSFNKDGNMTVIGLEALGVGRYMSTKAVGAISREDVTHHYKHTESTSEEQIVLLRAGKQSFRKFPVMSRDNFGEIDFHMNGEGHRTGDIEVTLKMRNGNAQDSRIVDVIITCLSAMYTGVAAGEIKEHTESAVIEPLAESTVVMTLKCGDYVNNMDGDSHVAIYLMAIVKETGQRFMRRESFWLDKPNLEIDAPDSVITGRQFDLCVKITNPMSVPLTGGHLNVEAPGMQCVTSVKVKKSIGPGEEVRETVQLKPRRTGMKEIIANFYCKQISNVSGVTQIEILGDDKV